MDLKTDAKPRFLNYEDPTAWFLTDLEDGSSPLSYIPLHVQSNCGIDIM